MGQNSQVNNMLIPNVSKLPKHRKIDREQKGVGNADEFKNLLRDQQIEKAPKSDKNIELSIHAAKRLKERNLEMDSAEFVKLKGAFEKLAAKGGQDSLVITDKAAYIVDVANQKIVTAIDKGNISENVFTKIDSTVLV